MKNETIFFFKKLTNLFWIQLHSLNDWWCCRTRLFHFFEYRVWFHSSMKNCSIDEGRHGSKFLSWSANESSIYSAAIMQYCGCSLWLHSTFHHFEIANDRTNISKARPFHPFSQRDTSSIRFITINYCLTIGQISNWCCNCCEDNCQ